jgi:hypothetical protein
MNWQKRYVRDNANCIVGIWDDEKKQWIEKEDTGTESFSEAEKGLASDSFKRACFNWGIGRELYTAPSIFILPNKEMIPKGKESEFFCKNPEETIESKKRYDTKTRFWVEYIDYNNDREIQNLIIRDNKNHIRFSKLTKEKEGELLKLQKELKTLIEKTEENDSKFDRERFYQYYGATGDNTLLYEQVKDGIEKLSKVKEKK